MLVGFHPYDAVIRNNIVLKMTNEPVNTGSTNAVAIASDPKPTTVDDYMNFTTGRQIIRYSDRPDWHVNAPYSVELDVFPTDKAVRWIATEGDGFGAGWPEWSIMQTSGALQFTTSWTNNGYDYTGVLLGAYNVNQWYRVGLMFYKVGDKLHVRGYLNNIKVFDNEIPQPITTTNRLAFGGDAVARTDRMFIGRLRNISIAKSLFWSI